MLSNFNYSPRYCALTAARCLLAEKNLAAQLYVAALLENSIARSARKSFLGKLAPRESRSKSPGELGPESQSEGD